MEAITWQAVAAVIAGVGLVLGMLWRVLAAITAVRVESAAGRKTMYERMDQLGRDIAGTYVRQDVHAADLRLVHHQVEEVRQQHGDLAARLRCQVHAGE